MELTELKGKVINNLDNCEKEKIIDKVFKIYRSNGFPYPSYNEIKLFKEYNKFINSKKRISNVKKEIKYSNPGLSIVNYFHPEIWSTKCERFRTPMEVFQSDILLKDCIRKSMKIANDRKPFKEYTIRGMLATYKNTKRVSNFRPTVARFLYEKYSTRMDTILDLAAGYGGRMLGSFPLSRKYIGIDPNKIVIKNNEKVVDLFKKHMKCKVELINECSEDIIHNFEKSSVDLAIFSPPYFRRERYSYSNNQSWVRYKTYNMWLSKFITKIIIESYRILKDNSFLILIVSNTESHNVKDDVLKLTKIYFKYHYKYKMKIGCVPYHRNGYRGGFRHEPIYIFKKES